MKRLLLAAVLAACGADGGSTPVDAATNDVMPDTAVSDDAPSEDPDREPLCEKLQGRIDACGHTYTFPGFEGWCRDPSRDDFDALTTCSIRPCAMLVTCLDEGGAPSEGL